MRGIDELDHYELLEISRNASADEIGRAYRLSQQTYGEGSLALYSVFESRDASAIRDRLDEAFRILSDSDLRARYDLSQGRGSGTSSTDTDRGGDVFASQPDHFVGNAEETSLGSTSGESVADEAEDYDHFQEDGEGSFDGVRLRRTRLFRGYEIDEISEVTKVSGSHLRNIEDENFVDLPADVYVRGFVTAYATTIGLDPKLVVPSYMERLQESRSENQGSRFLGRR